MELLLATPLNREIIFRQLTDILLLHLDAAPAFILHMCVSVRKRLMVSSQALEYRSFTDIVRPIREIVRRREEGSIQVYDPSMSRGLYTILES